MSEDAAIEPAQPEVDTKRGRPRPQATLQRDAAVRDALRNGGAMSKKELAEKLGWEEKLVYQSLWRLRFYDGEVHRIAGKARWELTAAPTE